MEINKDVDINEVLFLSIVDILKLDKRMQFLKEVEVLYEKVHIVFVDDPFQMLPV